MKRKPPTGRQDTEPEKGKAMFQYCDAREQRVNALVCQANILKGKCHKTLLKCKPARTPKATDPDPAPITDTQDEPEPQDNDSPAPIQAEPIQTREGQLDLFNLVERKGR